MRAYRTQLSTGLGLLVLAGAMVGCDMQSSPNSHGGKTTVIETHTTTGDPAVRVRLEPAPATGAGDVRVNVDPQTGVHVDVDGKPLIERLRERRETPTTTTVTP